MKKVAKKKRTGFVKKEIEKKRNYFYFLSLGTSIFKMFIKKVQKQNFNDLLRRYFYLVEICPILFRSGLK